MPELPEVEAVCRKLRPAEGARVIQMRFTRPSLAKPQRASRIEQKVAGAVIQQIARRGKNILLWLDSGDALHVHLRMTGNLLLVPDVRLRSVGTRAWMELEGGRGIIYEDPRALGKIHLLTRDEVDKKLSAVGIEPLSDTFTLEHLASQAANSRKPAKLFLMDQRHVAGLGNIYAAEALFRARVHPQRPIGELRKPKLTALHTAIRDVLAEAMDSAVAAYAEPDRFNEGESFPCAVYDREGEPCPRCGRKVKRIPQGGRSTYFCGGCQK
ncbi:MAG: bifunctional DNA-formamidopyrimidine glycosylase/DNA-(apurinic or apyrimidinic site) lyase [Acidobacteria bacterium]|nr:bifunctional DNA-formamidopyrimidine glycosylase/DNA-(apurinic or apyrimidinic site) lyase [Acidobacteriota bacterium]